MIEGIILTTLETHHDERGFFREIVRCSALGSGEKFGQLSHSLVLADVIKAWHMHRIQTDWWYICTGIIRVGLCDLREVSSNVKETMDFRMGDGEEAQVLMIPPGVAHGYRVLEGPVNVIYMTSHEYNPEDEIRIPIDDPRIGFDWGK